MSSVAKKYVPPEKAGRDFWGKLGIPSRGAKLHAALREGVRYQVYVQLAAMAGLEQKTLAQYVAIAPATLQRRARSGRFKTDESDRLYRFAEVLKAATDLFEGDEEGAREWMRKPVRGLGGVRPVEMVATSAEAEAVLDLIGRMEHGVFA
jgi:putative toxin-antitoxin system antitoxin component (TIGR02293 family)